MDMICQQCGKAVWLSGGKYIYDLSGMKFACRSCAIKLNDEIRSAMKICAVVNGKKKKAENVISDQESFKIFISQINMTLKKIPEIGSLRSDISVLVALLKSYVSGEYRDISNNSIIAAAAALLYVISPVDVIPDSVPRIGFTDDTIAVSLCMRMISDDLEKYVSWCRKAK